jgi:CRP/FNR family transcriptional regulator
MIAVPNELLRNCFLCRELNNSELDALVGIVTLKSMEKGQTLFWEGDTATGFYILLQGNIRIYKTSPEGKEFTIHQIRPGQMFAEAAIFSLGGYPANATALADSTVAFFPKDKFIKLVTDSPNISIKMIVGLAAFVREFNQMVEDLSLKEVPARLAGFLLDEHGRVADHRILLDTTKAELANKLGTTSETLSRNLRKLKELQVIAVDGNCITILDFPHLEAIAAGEKI